MVNPEPPVGSDRVRELGVELELESAFQSLGGGKIRLFSEKEEAGRCSRKA